MRLFLIKIKCKITLYFIIDYDPVDSHLHTLTFVSIDIMNKISPQILLIPSNPIFTLQ